MTLPLTPEQNRAVVEALQRDRHAWLSVGCDPMSAMYHQLHNGDHDTVAPPEWVEAAALSVPCWWCSGRENKAHQCPVCIQRKPIHTLSVECPVRYVVAELVPVVDLDGCSENTKHICPAYGADGQHYHHRKLDDDDHRYINVVTETLITVIGDPQPGDWVAHLEAVT